MALHAATRPRPHTNQPPTAHRVLAHLLEPRQDYTFSQGHARVHQDARNNPRATTSPQRLSNRRQRVLLIVHVRPNIPPHAPKRRQLAAHTPLRHLPRLRHQALHRRPGRVTYRCCHVQCAREHKVGPSLRAQCLGHSSVPGTDQFHVLWLCAGIDYCPS